MTRPLRRTHFIVWCVLAFVLPLILVAAINARRTTTPANPTYVPEQYR